MKKIYVIHGWTYTTDAWRDVFALLREKGYEPVMLNVPGLTERSDEVWTLDMYVAWLDQKLAQDSTVTLMGHSNGGRIAIAYQARKPGKIAKLILLDAAGIVHNEKPLRWKRKIFGMIAKIAKPFIRSQNLRSIYYKLIGARDYENASPNMRATMSNLITQDLTSELSKIQIPTLIIWGEKDTETPLSDAHVMHEKIHDSKLVIIPDIGHSPHVHAPDRVVGEVISWT